MTIIAKHTGIIPLELITPGRKQEVVDAREIFVRVARDVLGFSYPRIGRELRMDHTSIIHLYRRKRISDLVYEKIRDDYVEKSAN